MTNLAIAEFLRLHTPYISQIEGGYMALHEALGPLEMGRLLIGHDSSICLYCVNKLENGTGQVRLNTSTNNKSIDEIKPLGLLKSDHFAKFDGNSIKGFFSKFSNALLKPQTLDTIGSKFSRPASGHSLVSSNKLLAIDRKFMISKIKSNDLILDDHRLEIGERSKNDQNPTSVFSIDDCLDEDDDDECGEILKDGSSIKKTMTIENLNKFDQNENKIMGGNWFDRFRNLSKISQSDPSDDDPIREGGLDCSQPGDLIDTTYWSRRSEVRGVFDIRFFKSKFELADYGFLLLSDRHLIVLKNNQFGRSPFQFLKLNFDPDRSMKQAIVLRRISFSQIGRITSNRNFPECITFHYNLDDCTDLNLLNVERFGFKDRIYIEKAGEAVKMVKLAVFQSFNLTDT